MGALAVALLVAAATGASFMKKPSSDISVLESDSLLKIAASVVVMVDTSKDELWAEDGSVAATYILLAAEQYGIGACWNQIRLRDGKRKSTSREICELLGVPPRFEVVCVVALGHPRSKLPPHRREDLDSSKIHMERF